MANIVQHEHKSRGARAATAGVSDQPEFKSNLVKFLPAATGEGTPTYFETVIRVASGKAARNANLVFVVDISGSMAGTPEKNVREVLREINGLTLGKEEVLVMLYNLQSYEMKLPAYLESKNMASGSTSFASAFTRMHTCLMQNPLRSYNFVFMTDGEDTENNEKKLKDAMTKFKLAANFSKERSVTVHALGFGSGVKQQFLESVITHGSHSGMFRFASESKELGGKFMDLFELSQGSVACEFAFGAERMSFQAVRMDNAPCECGAGVPASEPAGAAGSDEKKASSVAVAGKGACKCGVAYRVEGMLPPAVKLQPGASVTVQVQGQKIALAVERMGKVAPMVRLRMLELREPRDEAEVKEIMGMLSRVIPKGISFSERLELEQARGELNARMTEYLTLFNQMHLGAISSQHGLKLKDLRYEAQFSKVRRQRTVALRQNANLKKFQSMDQQLEAVTDSISTAEWEELRALADQWSCQLSLDTVYDVMRDTPDDFLCLGMLVEREETIIDAPTTGFRLLSVSSTVISYNTFVDAMTKAVAEKGAAAAHGGFKNTARIDRYDVNDERSLAEHKKADQAAAAATAMRDDQPFAVVGQAREKINAVIPLFLHEAHYRRIRALLPAWCGFFFTLDPFGYDRNQEPGLVTLLATMIMQHPGTQWYENVAVGEFAKICTRLVKESPGFLEACPREKYDLFVNTVYGRQKQFFPNLLTPLGVAYCLDKHDAELRRRNLAVEVPAPAVATATTSTAPAAPAGAAEAADAYPRTREACLPVCWEAMKRAIMNQYKASKVEAHAVAKQLLYGDGTKRKSRSDEKNADAPWEVQRMKMEQEFAAYFLDPSDSKVPRLAFDEKTANAADKAGVLEIVDTSLVKHIIKQHIVPVPVFIKKFYAAINVSSSRVETEQARRHLLLAFFYHNEYPPERITEENVYEYAHAKFVADNENESRNADLSVYQQSVANAISDAEDICAFAGMLRVYCPSRGNNIFQLTVENLVRRNAADKLEVLLRNKVQDAFTLYQGPLENVAWVPLGYHLLQKVRDIVGSDALSELESYHRKKRSIRSWRYRESDLPNRHGFHNSHPNPKLTKEFNKYDQM